MSLLLFFLSTAPVYCLSSRKSTKKKIKTSIKTMEDEVKVHILENLEQTLKFPFFTDKRTVNYIQHSKVIFIMRGLPGSGKSTIVKLLREVYPNSVSCSADDYFLVDGEYEFDATQLKDAHELCQKRAKEACEASVPIVVIDNTNVRRWEMRKYLDLAWQFNYTVVIVAPKTAWRFKPEELALKNKHGLDAETLKIKVQLFERLSPVYFGWFVKEELSRHVRFIAKLLFRECVNGLANFGKELLYSIKSKTHAGSISESEQDELMKHFPWPDGELLHCTAKFCNKGRAPGAFHYMDRQDVTEAIGKAFQLNIVGFAFTQDTISARLSLYNDALSLYDKPEERERDEIIARNTSEEAQLSQIKFSKSETEIPVKSKKVGSPHDYEMCIHGAPKEARRLEPIPPPTGFARSAHLTVCCAENIYPSKALYDNLDICDMESGTRAVHTVAVTGGRAAYLDHGLCAVYLYRPIPVTALFSAVYV